MDNGTFEADGGSASGGSASGFASLATPSGTASLPGIHARAPAQGPSAAPGVAVRCLLIDDSKYDRQRLRRISEQTRLDLTFTEAPDLDSAVAALRAGKFDLIMLDQSLPDGDGTAIAELLKTHLGDMAPPILMISGSVETAMPKRALASGCAGYISKDNLSTPGLESAILGVIARPGAAQDQPAISAEDHRAALQSFAGATAQELHAPLSRILKMLAQVASRHPAAAGEIAEIRAVCHEMRGYLEFIRAEAPE